MSKIFKRTGVITVVVLILVLGMTAVGYAAGGPDTWNLNSSDHSQTGKVMETTGGQSGCVTIPANDESVTWLSAEHASAGGITFDDGWWVIALHKCDSELSDWPGDWITCEIGAYDGISTYDDFDANFFEMVDDENDYVEVKVQKTSAWTLDEGEYLYLKISNSDVSDHQIKTNGDSELRTPAYDPGGFVPELTTGILLGVGLLGLGGFIFIKRKRAGKASN